MELGVVELDGLEVWRVGRRPNPWAWVPWEAAHEGTFGGRWDDPNGRFRTIYAGSSLLGCLLEVLAGFRVDPTVAAALADIDEDIVDLSACPTAVAGEVDPQWLATRLASRGALRGTFCRISDSQTVAALHPQFVNLARAHGLQDFDAAAIKDGRARGLTQAIAGFLHGSTEHEGLQFASRHGDDQTLWAIFERGEGTTTPRCVADQSILELTLDHPAITQAFAMLGLRWAGDGSSEVTGGDLSSAESLPLPLVEADAEAAMAAMFPDGGPTPKSPLGAAMLWWSALQDPVHFRVTLEQLSVNASDWGDFGDAARRLADKSITQLPIESEERPGEVCYVKFISMDGAEVVQAFADAPIDDVWLLTMVRVGEEWKVWGLSHNYLPPANRVFR